MRLKIGWLLAFAVLATVTARGGQVVIGDFSSSVSGKGVPEGWELKEKAGRAELQVVKSDGEHALQLKSDNSSFCLQRGVQVDLKETPFLSWKWKVTRLPEGGDFRRTKTDDQAAQLFVAFNRTQAIVYLWDSTAPEGLMADAPSPPFISIKAVVVRSKSEQIGKWLSETRNVYEDYKKFFGSPQKPPVVSGVRLQINTQHTRGSAECFFADVRFKSDVPAKEVASR